MKRQLLIAFIACTAALHANGQGAGPFKQLSGKYTKEDRAHVQSILASQDAGHIAAKTTGPKKRLIGYSYVSGGVLEDSSSFYYSAGRGSTHPHLFSYFDSYMPRDLGSASGGSVMNQQFIKCDSSRRWALDMNSNVALVQKKSYQYDAQNRVTSQVDSNVLWWYDKIDLGYNASGKLDYYIAYDTTGGSPLIPKYKVFVQYDAQGKRVLDSSVSLIINMPVMKIIYTYDNNGNLIAREYSNFYLNQWNPYFRYDYLYDNNRLTSYSAQYSFGTVFVNTFKDSFEYVGSNTHFSTYMNYFWNDNTNTWDPDTREIDVVNAQGLVDTYYLHKWNGIAYDTMEKNIVVYDSDGLALRTNAYVYNGNGVYNSTSYDQQTMYYETYFDLDVEEVTSPVTLTLYPNPTTEQIYLRHSVQGAVRVSIYNAEGKLVLSLTSAKSAESINVAAFAPGTYFLLLQDQKSQSVYKGQFIKL